MCGFAGYITRDDISDKDLRKAVSTLRHRGPDDEGVWCDLNEHIFLAHARLSILDLSPAGHQPMSSVSGRYMIVFNGEIYNHQELRKELNNVNASISWCGHSDTETLLAGFEAWGVDRMIKKVIGMFAFALWDKQNRTLILGRDRLGEKPLYYGWQGETFLFGSELKALKVHPSFNAEVDRNALALLMRHNCIPAPYSIYKGISKLPPGCLLTVSLSQHDPRIIPYWSVKQAVYSGHANPFAGSASEAVSALEDLLMDAVSHQMIADVPLGAFLSGGVDSSTVVALMQAQSTRPVRTFSIGFQDDLYNEAAYAKAVAQHLNTNHTEMYVSSKDALDVIPILPNLYDEPFSDSSQIPTYLLSKITRQQVTVSLSGDAGDELFCGYNRYVRGYRLWRFMTKVPVPLRRGILKGVTSLSSQNWNALIKTFRDVLPAGYGSSNWGDMIHKGAGVLSSSTLGEFYLGLVSHWGNPSSLVLGSTEPDTVLMDSACYPEGLSEIERMMVLDQLSYLPDDILCKVDRAAMGVSLETRIPFLDHRVVEFAWSLPLEYKLRNGSSKWVLRQILYKYVPKMLIERPKTGFGVPIDSWLRGPLRDWAESLLDESRLRQEGYFNPEPIRRKWTEHLSSKHNWQYHLWDVLMFQAWKEAQ